MILKSCPHCGSDKIEQTVAIIRQGTTGIACRSCGEVFVDDHSVKSLRHGRIATNAGQTKTPSFSLSATTPSAPSIKSEARERYGCPSCGEAKDLSPNPGLRRGSKTGHICNCCGMAFVDHPDLKRRSIDHSRLELSSISFSIPLPSKDAVEGLARRLRRPPNAPSVAKHSDGKWLIPRKAT